MRNERGSITLMEVVLVLVGIAAVIFILAALGVSVG